MKIKLNDNFSLLSQKYLFSEMRDRVEGYKSNGESRKIISLGIGDVSLPISSFVADEMARAARGMSTKKGFRGYGDTRGDKKLREKIVSRYACRGVELDIDEIFVNDGAKGDLGNINDVLGDNEVVICNPVYPVYFDSAIISGRRVKFVFANVENGFLPTPNQLYKKPYVIYLCSPNNPTGAVFSKDDLQKWVDFALESGSLIVFDAAYESYITDESLPHSIFEMKGAKECAIEVCSLSKMAGFTGIRCGWTVIARGNPIYKLWERRQGAKFNGASYISQKGAIASLSENGMRECRQNIEYYMKNARLMSDFLKRKHVDFVGGVNAPYLWVKCPNKMNSWQFFDFLLNKSQIISTPGVGFGNAGEGYVRFSAFAELNDTLEALSRMDEIL